MRIDDYYIFVPLTGGIISIVALAVLAFAVAKRNPGNATMIDISTAIQAGSRTYLKRTLFVFAICIAVLFGLIWVCGISPATGINSYVAIPFLIGAVSTGLAGWIGLLVALRANNRAAEAARVGGAKGALRIVLDAGAAMGMAAIGMTLLGFCLAWVLFWNPARPMPSMTLINGYALGIMTIALLARLSGGIFAKSADLGADSVARLEGEITDTDPRNGAVIADHLGDNVNDVGGFGGDLMATYAGGLIAAVGLAVPLRLNTALMAAPMFLATAGVVASIVGIYSIRLFARNDPRRALLHGSIVSIALMILMTAGIFWGIGDGPFAGRSFDRRSVLVATLCGIFAGILVALATEYFTSNRRRPTRRIAESGQFGPALEIAEGLRAGMSGCALPAVILAAALWVAYGQAGHYGIALAAFGMLATAGMVVSLNAFAPVADNCGGIAEMAHMDRSVREITGLLNSVGDSATAMAKGFANGAAVMVTLALLIVFMRTVRVEVADLSIMNPRVLAGLMIGGALPWLISSFVIGSITRTAIGIVDEVRRQLRDIPGILEGKGQPDYSQCIDYAAQKSIIGALTPAIIAVAAPIVVGIAFGPEMLAAMLAGSLLSGLMLGSQAAHTGSALGGARQYIEEGILGGEGSIAHEAVSIGDAVGDPLKDAVAPAINIVIQTMAVTALVIAPMLRALAK